MDGDTASSEAPPVEMPAQHAVVVAEEPRSLLAAIVQLASNPAVDVQKLDALLNMQERMERRQAEVEFNQALGRLSMKMGTPLAYPHEQLCELAHHLVAAANAHAELIEALTHLAEMLVLRPDIASLCGPKEHADFERARALLNRIREGQ